MRPIFVILLATAPAGAQTHVIGTMSRPPATSATTSSTPMSATGSVPATMGSNAATTSANAANTAATSATTAPSTTFGAPTNPATTNAQSSATPTGVPSIPSSAQGVPPTPTPAFPGLPVPQATGGLPSGTPPSPLTQDLRTPVSLTPSQVADMQSRLLAAGFYHGPVDGAMTGSTRSAIRAYQQAARLPVTGQPDAATAASIGVSSAATATAVFGTPFPLTPTSESTVFVQP